MSKKEESYSREVSQVYEYEFAQFVQMTNIHGMARWKKAQTPAKIFWTAVGVSVFIFSIMQVSYLVSIYLGHPTVSVVRSVIPEEGMPFPTVTICNHNPVKSSAVEKYQMDSKVLEYVLMTYLQAGDLSTSYSQEEIESLHSAYENYTMDYKNKTGTDFSIPAFFWNTGYSCEDMFLSCTFGGLPFPCCSAAQPLLTDMGKCYRFDYGQNNSRQWISGPYYGFQAFINAQLDEYPLTFVNNLFEYGIRINIQQIAATPYMSKSAYSVSPGNRFYAGILPSHYILLPEEKWGKCRNTWPNLNFEGPYTSSNCQAHCIARSYLEKCGCVPMRYFPTEGVSCTRELVCDSLNLYNCMKDGYLPTDSAFWNNRCSSCSIECDHWSYDIQSSYVRIPSPAATLVLPDRFNMSEYDFTTNVLAVTTYFTEIGYTEYQQRQAATLSQTFSDVGGTLGLFIGFSVVTIFEVLIFFSKVLWGVLSGRRRRVLTTRNAIESISRNIKANKVLVMPTVKNPMKW